jgi:hypothetical protein
MNAVIETHASIEAVLEGQAPRENLPSGTRISTLLSVPARLPLRQARQRWNSSLSDQDLQCLLQIIEADLVPQLLNSYSPARYAPDDRLTSS